MIKKINLKNSNKFFKETSKIIPYLHLFVLILDLISHQVLGSIIF